MLVVISVTHNSASVITTLLCQLKTQTLVPDHVVIVDTASTDNTLDIIDEFDGLVIKTIALTDNVGGAGGFSRAFSEAMALGADHIVSFDDDAYPKDDDFIQNLLALANQGYDVVSGLVVDIANHQKSAYEYLVDNVKHTQVADIQKQNQIDDIKLFNGVLFCKNVIAHLKGPRPEFFIRGDEQEFKSRIICAGYRVATDTKSIVYHPSSIDEYVVLNNVRFHHLESALKLFYSTRNRFYMLRLRQDFGLFKKMRIALKELKNYSWFYLIYRKGDIKNFNVWLKAFCYGLMGKMTNVQFL